MLGRNKMFGRDDMPMNGDGDLRQRQRLIGTVKRDCVRVCYI